MYVRVRAASRRVASMWPCAQIQQHTKLADPTCLYPVQVLKGQSTVKWAFAPLESLYDVEAIVKNWEELGTKASCLLSPFEWSTCRSQLCALT